MQDVMQNRKQSHGTSLLKISSRLSGIILTLIAVLAGSIEPSFASSTNVGYNFEISVGSGWIDCGGSNWVIDTDEGYSSGKSFRSGEIDGIGVSSICRDVLGSAVISFAWKKGNLSVSDNNYADLLLFLDGNLIMKCESSNWKQVKLHIPDGSHRLSWELRKYSTGSSQNIAGWIGDFVVEAPSTANLDSTDVVSISELKKIIGDRVEVDHPNVQNEARLLASKASGNLDAAKICEIYDHMINGWVHVSDPRGFQYYQYANETLRMGNGVGSVGIGDCDDFAIAMASIIESLGGTTRIALASAKTEVHAYAEVYLGNLNDKDNSIEDVINWIKKRYNVAKINTHEDVDTRDVWLNLDTSFEGKSYPGGPYFDADNTIIVYSTTEINKNPISFLHGNLG